MPLHSRHGGVPRHSYVPIPPLLWHYSLIILHLVKQFYRILTRDYIDFPLSQSQVLQPSSACGLDAMLQSVLWCRQGYKELQLTVLLNKKTCNAEWTIRSCCAAGEGKLLCSPYSINTQE